MVLVSAVIGCSPYRPANHEAGSDRYPTPFKVDPGGILAFDTSIDPREYRYVLLFTETTQRPPVLAFTIRLALANLGIVRVYTPAEFMRLAQDHGVQDVTEDPDVKSVRQFAASVGPVLVVDFQFKFLGGGQLYSRLDITDVGTGKPLLSVDHPRRAIGDGQADSLHPVLNVMQDWARKSARGRT